MLERCADGMLHRLGGSCTGLAQQYFQLGEDLLDRIEVGRIGGQEQAMRPDRSYGIANRPTFVRSKIVHNDDVASREGRNQELLDIGTKALPVDRTVEHAGRGDTIAAQGGDEGQGGPFPVWHLLPQPLTARRPSPQRRHIGLGPRLINKDQTCRID